VAFHCNVPWRGYDPEETLTGSERDSRRHTGLFPAAFARAEDARAGENVAGFSGFQLVSS